MDMPCPPLQWLPVNTTPEPELMAMQSSWFITVLRGLVSTRDKSVCRNER
jgi:hypothetical protein